MYIFKDLIVSTFYLYVYKAEILRKRVCVCLFFVGILLKILLTIIVRIFITLVVCKVKRKMKHRSKISLNVNCVRRRKQCPASSSSLSKFGSNLSTNWLISKSILLSNYFQRLPSTRQQNIHFTMSIWVKCNKKIRTFIGGIIIFRIVYLHCQNSNANNLLYHKLYMHIYFDIFICLNVNV